MFWRARDDLNVRPQPSEGCALSGLSYERMPMIYHTSKRRENHFNLIIFKLQNKMKTTKDNLQCL